MSLMPGQGEVDQLLDGMVDDLFEDGLSALEQRRQLEQSVSLKADIENDLAGKGPLFLYLKRRRKVALEALEALVTVDATNAPGIAKLQTLINEYIRPCEWVAARLEEGAQDAQTIKEEYPENGDEPQRYDQD